jgi:ParB family chromosome partitioning protein
MNKPRGLGKGLGALIPELDESNLEPQSEVEIHLIDPNPFQPRREFSDDKLNELAESIRIHGIIQPLIVRENNGRYQLIAGERRLRASKIVGLTSVPVVIHPLSDQSMMEVALVENLQREDLNPIEEAEAYRRLINEFNLTQDELAQKMGKSRPAIANILRLLNLPQPIQHDLSSGILTMGHARTILALKTPDDQNRIWARIKEKQLSVRETEELIKKLTEPAPVSRETKPSNLVHLKDPNLMDFEEELQQIFGTKVIIKPAGSGGRIEIDYYSSEDFERIFEKLTQ